MTVVVRGFRPADQAAVIDLWTECGLVRPWNDPAVDIASKLADRADELIVAETRDGAVIGSAMLGYDGHRGWIYYLAVSPAHQRSGVGRTLVREAEARLAARGCRKVNLMIRGDNADATHFYQRVGYQPSDVVVLGRWLDDGDPDRPPPSSR